MCRGGKGSAQEEATGLLKAVQPVIDIASQEYLTFSKAAILMGCSRQYVYKLVNEENFLHHESAAEWHSSVRQTSR